MPECLHTTILDRLKNETMPLHQEVERLAASNQIEDLSLSREQYQQLIMCHYHFHCALERKLEVVEGIYTHPTLEYSSRIKTDALEADMKLLGMVPPMDPDVSFGWASAQEVWGAMYVSEGSMMGAGVILRSLVNNPNLKGIQRFNFYSCYGKSLGTMWQRFRRALLQVKATDKELLKGAQKAFQLYGTLFQRYLKMGE